MARDTFFGRNMIGQEQWARRGEAASAAATAVSAALPVGVISAYYGTIAPTDWLLCDGGAIPAQYGTLIALVGANTPNLKGRVLVGLDAAQTEFDTLGETGGSKISTAPHSHSHNHGSHAHSHTHGGTQGESGHVHSEIASGQGNILLTPGANNYNLNFGAVNTGGSSGHTHGIDADATGATPTTDSAASSAAATSGNLPPYIAINYIIKAV